MNTHYLAPVTALAAMCLALVVALADRPREEVVSGAWPVAVEAGTDHISPAELSQRLLAQPESVLLVDVRPAFEFEAFHLPGAVNLDVAELLGARGADLLAAHAGRLVVLCSNGMTHPAQAWVELARRGYSDVRVLEDGLDGFVRDVLTPPSLRGVTTEARAARELVAFRTARAAFLPGAATAMTASAASTKPDPAVPPKEVASLAADSAPTTPTTPKPSATPSKSSAAERQSTTARLATDPTVLTQPTIVSTAWVAERGARIVVLDTRDKDEEYAAGHLPGALHVSIKATRAVRAGVADELLAPDQLADLFGQLGIDADTEVALYADAKLQDPTHMALALISVGHQRIAIMEGGWRAWTAEGRAFSTATPAPVAKAYVPRANTSLRQVALDDVQRASTGSAPRILDVRPADAFRGDVSTEARAGHIPNSLNRPYTSDVASTDAGLFWRPLADLRREYEALGLAPHDPVIVSCRTGHQASQTWFTLRYLLGYENVSWYDGSWKEWAAHPELPIATSTTGR